MICTKCTICIFYVNICIVYRCVRACVFINVTFVNSYVKNYYSIDNEKKKRLKNHFHRLDHGFFFAKLFVSLVYFFLLSANGLAVLLNFICILLVSYYCSPFEFGAILNSSFSLCIWLCFTIFTKFEIHLFQHTNGHFQNDFNF